MDASQYLAALAAEKIFNTLPDGLSDGGHSGELESLVLGSDPSASGCQMAVEIDLGSDIVDVSTEVRNARC